MSTQLIESAHSASEQWQWKGEQKDVIKSILETPLFEGEWYWIMPNEAELDYEIDGDCYQVNSVKFDSLKVVLWGDHPSEFLAEDAVDDGSLSDDDLYENGIPEEIWNRGNEMAKEVVLDWMGEDLEFHPELKTDGECYSRMGGWYFEIDAPEGMTLQAP